MRGQLIHQWLRAECFSCKVQECHWKPFLCLHDHTCTWYLQCYLLFYYQHSLLCLQPCHIDLAECLSMCQKLFVPTYFTFHTNLESRLPSLHQSQCMYCMFFQTSQFHLCTVKFSLDGRMLDNCFWVTAAFAEIRLFMVDLLGNLFGSLLTKARTVLELLLLLEFYDQQHYCYLSSLLVT